MTIAEAQDLRDQGGAQDGYAARPSAVVWINGRCATIALIDGEGRISTCEIDRGVQAQESFLAMVVRAVGDRERIVILGPNSMRLALEREYVAIHRRPDRLVDVEPAGLIERQDLIRRLRELAT